MVNKFGEEAQVQPPPNRVDSTVSIPNYGTPTVSADNPWPGLLAFREADQDYFEGRDAETEELFSLVMRERLTVFFGLSGLGKSSLLQAGLFPLLRRESILPIYVRLDFSSPEPDLIAQVKSAIVKQAELAAIDAPASKPDETLWEYFHRQENEFWTRRNRPAVPLLSFDQFEECFTLGKLDARRAQATETLFDQLAYLAEGRPPAALKQWLDEHPEGARNFSFARHSYKLVLSIREDFLPELEALRERMPSIAVNRLRLQRMNGTAALQVVSQAEHLIALPVAEKVVRFVGAGRSGVSLEKLEIEPALLSVVCRELNGERQTLHEPKITETLLEGSRDEVLSNFYERTVSDLPVEVRSFIEERLLTASGFRDSIALENAFNLPGVTAESINQLVERRLLRREDRGGVQRLELTHDLLTGVIRASRDRRHQQEAAEKARLQLLEEQERERQLLNRQREEEEKRRAIKELRRTRKVAAGLVLLAIVAIGGLVWAIYSRSEMQKAISRTQEAVAEAGKARTQAENVMKRIEQTLLIRQAALSGDEAKLNGILSNFDQNDNIRFGADAIDRHYSNPSGQHIYKFEMFPRKETLPSGKGAVAFITYLAAHPSFRNTLLTAGPDRDFRVSYEGWGCLHRIVALTEYADPEKLPTVTIFDQCKLLPE